jgi:hypothetical protein
VITRDEERRLPACLASLAFCDEVVVVDSGSRDATVAIARAAGARVVENAWPGFAAQRNVAAGHAAGPWVLEVDADERVTRALAAEISAFLAAPPPGVDIAGMPIRELFLGRALGPAANHPNYRLRLFRRDAYRHDERRTVHEGLEPRGRAWAFEGALEHVLAESRREALADLRAYARLEARQVAAPRGTGALVRAIVLRPAAKAAYRLLLRGAWRDGPQGIAKVLLDSASDALVWVHSARARRGEPGALGSGAHFGHGRRHQGAARVVALAGGARASADAADWLARARAAGGDVALVTDAELAIDPRELHVRTIPRLGPFATLRALEAESRLRALDALLPFGRRAQLLARAVPAPVRGPAGVLRPGDPATVLATAERARR